MAPEPTWVALSFHFPLKFISVVASCFQAQRPANFHHTYCFVFSSFSGLQWHFTFLKKKKLLRLCLFLLYFKIFYELLFGAGRYCVCVCLCVWEKCPIDILLGCCFLIISYIFLYIQVVTLLLPIYYILLSCHIVLHIVCLISLYWSMVDSQCCVNWCCSAKWFSYTCIFFCLICSFPLWFIMGYWI